MKLKHEFTIRQIVGEYVLIPMGKSALAFSGMVTTNAVGGFICEQLAQETTKEELLKRICREFQIDAVTAEKDLEQFLGELRKANLLVE